MELPKRKNIRLKEYNYASNGAYFVTICVEGRKQILSTINVGDDAHIVPQIELSKYGKVVEKYINNIKGIDKYVIMPNHIHMIIFIKNENGTMWASSPTNQSISQLIKSFKTLVTKELGCSVFQRSFYEHVIRNEKDYQDVWNYINGNPMKWGEDVYYEKS